MGKSKVSWTFILKGAAKILHSVNMTEEDYPSISLYATTYKSAVNKVIKLRLPGVSSEEDIQWLTICEEQEGDEEVEKQIVE